MSNSARLILPQDFSEAESPSGLYYIAYGMPPAVVGLLLILDSALVGFIALLLGSSFWTIYRFRILNSRAEV